MKIEQVKLILSGLLSERKLNNKEKEAIKVAIDAYGEDESLYINLSNNGLEIPYTIQKAIYESNVHEDNPDIILVNRKSKALLSNYWDILANKGSYKSESQYSHILQSILSYWSFLLFHFFICFIFQTAQVIGHEKSDHHHQDRDHRLSIHSQRTSLVEHVWDHR